MICVILPAFAQEKDSDEESVTMKAEEDAPGDVLILKNGDQITGFQILRADHKHFILEGLYDPVTDETLEIKVSRGQVVEVIRDDIEPAEQRAEAQKKALARTRTTVQGARLSDTLYGLLEKVIGDPPLGNADSTLAEVLEEVSKRVNGALKMANPVKESPRKWKGSITPDMTLATFLDNEIAQNYPGLSVVFNEKVVNIRPKAEPGAPPAGVVAKPPAGNKGGRGGGRAGGRAGRGGN